MAMQRISDLSVQSKLVFHHLEWGEVTLASKVIDACPRPHDLLASTNEDEWTPLDAAAYKGDVESVRMLLGKMKR